MVVAASLVAGSVCYVLLPLLYSVPFALTLAPWCGWT